MDPFGPIFGDVGYSPPKELDMASKAGDFYKWSQVWPRVA